MQTVPCQCLRVGEKGPQIKSKGLHGEEADAAGQPVSSLIVCSSVRGRGETLCEYVVKPESFWSEGGRPGVPIL